MSRLFTHHDRLILYKAGGPVAHSANDEDEEIEAPRNFMIYIPHIHKLFGLFALINIACYITPLHDTVMDVVGVERMRVLSVVHVLLALTSFEFRIGRSRSNQLYTIYREMQLHTVVFTFRSWAVMICAQYFQCESVLARAPAVLFWHVLADVVTKYFGTPTGGTTIRRTTDGGKTTGYKNEPLVTRAGIWFFSFSQLVGTFMMLTDSTDSARMAMCVMGPVQISAFLATLVRKGYFHSRTSFVCYLSVLTPIFFIHQWRPMDVAFLIAITVFRFNFRVSKYVMWIGVILAFTYLSGELGAVSYTHLTLPTKRIV
eukprot:TRINITY_DN12142_c0_g1_i3.p1 TRINITY_DN12142_c0_g1~~TRINITY_DN12142_c0_g1_i3.p1  ORF type:complete len:315 (-),score=79.47 TRINITY_DN12142_c0_g1_i3:95-1039(-)